MAMQRRADRLLPQVVLQLDAPFGGHSVIRDVDTCVGSSISDDRVHDAKMPDAVSSEPTARVPLPQRVPFGFHGSWIAG